MNFYFYDLETSGLDPFRDRIMQFGGQPADADLQPLGEVEEFYVKLSEDILPNPQAIMTHEILPQTANLEGLNEPRFLDWLEREVYAKTMIYGGFNLADFDNRFMRWLHWRNFAPPAPMSLPGASLDIYRLARLAADLRPEGMEWPKAAAGRRPSLSLTALAAANDIPQGGHKAGADVAATLAVGRRLKEAQPKLFQHFLELLKPDFVKQIIGADFFVYSGYGVVGGATTTLATVLADHPVRAGCFIVYDLRQPPAAWQKLSAYELSLRLKNASRQPPERPPFSVLDISRAPAVAPPTVLDKPSSRRLGLSRSLAGRHLAELRDSQLSKTISEAFLKLAQESSSSTAANEELALASQAPSKADEQKRALVRAAKAADLPGLELDFEDPRFKQLLFLYQARNFPKSLRMEQLVAWENYKQRKFLAGKPSGLDGFKRQLRQSLSRAGENPETLNLLEELQFYIETILPEPASSSPG